MELRLFADWRSKVRFLGSVEARRRQGRGTGAEPVAIYVLCLIKNIFYANPVLRITVT